MSTELLIAVLSAVVAVGSAIVTIWGQGRNKRLEFRLRKQQVDLDQQRQATQIISRYREPLADAAFELQSRIYNLVVLGLLANFYEQGSDREKHYVVTNTAFLLAQFLGWAEIIRTDVQFLDLGEQAKTQTLMARLYAITQVWRASALHPSLRLFRGQQRAIGEEMIHLTPEGKMCLGYSAFLQTVSNNQPEFLIQLHSDLAEFVRSPNAARERLVQLQHCLIDLLNFLDPKFVRFLQEERTKI